MEQRSCCTDLERWSKILLLRSIQSIHDLRMTVESKHLRSVLGNLFLAPDHHSAKEKGSRSGNKACQCKDWRIAYQHSLEKGQLTSRWVIVSEAWQQRAQLSSSCKLCLFLLAVVQQQSWSTSQPKNLHLPGAWVFFRIVAPGMEYWPMKNAL